jgi:hypothetical protein
MQLECGDYRIIDFNMNAVFDKDVDPLSWPASWACCGGEAVSD